MSINKFDAPFEYRLIYVFRINDSAHKDMLKVGEATIHATKKYNEYAPSCSELNSAANHRIKQYTNTAGVAYQLLYTEIAVYDELQKDGLYKTKYFTDHKVHNVLKRSGIKNHFFDNNIKANEWFITDLETVKKAIKAVKNNQTALPGYEVTNYLSPIVFRPEQEKAIVETIKKFEHSNKMLWNAKMRFGKTLSALEVIKRAGFKKSIIITHRPDVDDGWFDDFNKIFYEPDTNYVYGSKKSGILTIKELLDTGKNFVYFASIQDLRGSIEVGGKYPKNDEVFSLDWDLVITDEAHEGTQTELGKKVREKLINENNKDLSLSGTPFNLFDLYSNDDTFTWDYIMEQEAKEKWMKDPTKLGDHNPYEELPKLNIFTYHLEKLLSTENGKFIDLDDKAFNFKEFFRTWIGDKEKDFEVMPPSTKKGDFVHENAIKAFLDLLCKKDDETNYPFSTEEYRDFFRHTLWMVPGVKEGKALAELLKNHSVFGSGQFKIVNVAGNGDDTYAEEQKALGKLRKAIGKNPEDTRTITISCGRLTTGVTVPEWTAVFMLAGSYSTDAKAYLQTIFRVQSPANINGKMKENCYVFDFAPDRTLKVIYDGIRKSASRRQPPETTEMLMGKFLNFCPVISFDVSKMIEFKAGFLLQEIKRVYTERVVDSGFEDARLYNDELLKLDGIELEKFDKLQKIIGKTKQTKKPSEVELANTGLTDEEREKLKELEKKKKDKLTPEQKKALEELRKKKEQKYTAISILRGISIRIPLLVYGMDKDYGSEIKIEDLLDDNIIDNESWKEFMPEGVTKELFKDFIKYYDKDIFISSCRKIRAISKNCDNYPPTERIQELVKLFAKFKNPDKETVLTPWKVVNLHMSETIGGYDFYDENHESIIDEPRFVNVKLTTDEVFSNNSNILEINSKTGLYPLYVAYTLFRKRLESVPEDKRTLEMQNEIWDKVIKEQLFVICKTPMAKQITKRTLLGYRKGKTNMHSFDDLVMQLKDKQSQFVQKILKPSFWNQGGNGTMKFNAVVGNPPYQGTNHQQIYPFFYLTSILLGENVSLIFPTGWQEPKNANNLGKLNTREVKADNQIVFIDNRQNVFPGISGAEWTNIILWKKNYNNGLEGAQKIYENGANPKEVELLWEATQKAKPEEIIKLAELVKNNRPFASMDAITSVRKPYGLSTDVIANSDAENKRKYNIGPLFRERNSTDDIKIYAKSGLLLYVPADYAFPKVTKAIEKYKVFIPYAWGNMSEKTGLGGAFSDIIIGYPHEACTETYLESGCFDDKETAIKHSKYLFTKFCRALLYVNKNSQHSTTSWGAIPQQDYNENWWNKSIDEIDEELFKKYDIPENIVKFVKNNIQKRSEANIVNYNDSSIIYVCKDNDSSAEGHFDGLSFIVKKGSKVSDHLAPSFEQYDKNDYNLRLQHENEGVIQNRIVMKDITFNSQSAATAYVTGHIANGSEWTKKNN